MTVRIPRKIGIDARAYGWTGIGRYARNLLATVTAEAQRTHADIEFVVFVPPQYAQEVSALPHTRVIPVRDSYYSLYEQTGFLVRLLRTKIDLMHFLHFNAPIAYRRPYVVTIHDLIRFHFPGQRHASTLHQWAYRAVFASAVTHARHIIAVSAFTKSELIRKFPSVAGNVSAIGEGVDMHFSPAATPTDDTVLKQRGITRPYVLYVGLWMKHKNLPRLLHAFRLAREGGLTGQLVMTGDRTTGGEDIHVHAHREGVADSLVLPGRVSDEELSVLYRHARTFVFPSLYEGFGLPPLEAMASGTPVVAARAGSLPEVLGDAALYTDPHSPRDIAAALLLLESDPQLRQQLRIRGFTRAKRFSWDTCGRATLELYKNSGGERENVQSTLDVTFRKSM